MKRSLSVHLEFHSHGEWRPVPVIVFRYRYTADMLVTLATLGHAWHCQDNDLHDRVLSELYLHVF